MYGDDLDKYNADPDVELVSMPVPDTARTEADAFPVDLPDDLKEHSSDQNKEEEVVQAADSNFQY